MGRSARQLEGQEPWSLGDGASALLGLIARNPTLVGGSTAFLVALSFVSANALWYQPHAHSGAFFPTRDFLRSGAPQLSPELPNETTILIERPEQLRQVVGDPTVKEVQETLRQLNFYDGDVDGLLGPNTRQAIEAYQAKMGMVVTGNVDNGLLDQLGTGSVKPDVLPSPAPRANLTEQTASTAPAGGEDVVAKPASLTRDERVAKVQAGLREFGNEAIEVDGLIGAQTSAAIKEFQSLFGLEVTGDADQAVYAKMKEIGLVE
jgi:peptidoglycan hydrolase-like protein with peptidoglycan-binding domain